MAARDVFARAVARGLAKFGEASLLQGADCGNVDIEYGVELAPGQLGTANDNHIARRDVATILKDYAPKVGQVLVHADGEFVLERLLEDDGVSRRFVVTRKP